MKLNKKGFTLIELLAVIVILAIIMLIATPRVLDIIEDARVGAAKSSAMGYINALEREAMARQLADNDTSLMNTIITGSDVDVVKVRGQKPTDVTIEIENGIVISGRLQFGSYVFEVEDDGTVSLVTED